jgi:hypothetical protein
VVAALFVSASFLASPLSPVYAGECSDGAQDYLTCIERFAEGLTDARPLHCLGCLRWDGHAARNRWAGPNAAARFRSCRKSSLRPRLATAGRRILDGHLETGGSRTLVRELLRTLAHYGIDRVGEHDVFQLLTANSETLFYIDLASLGDPRTVPLLRTRYQALRDRGLGSDADREELVAVLNCLYHVPTAAAVRLAAEIRDAESDPLVVERAQLVVDRP